MGVFDKYVKSFLVSQPGVDRSITDWSVVCWCLGWRNQLCSNHVERSDGDSSGQVDTTNSNIANFTDRDRIIAMKDDSKLILNTW